MSVFEVIRDQIALSEVAGRFSNLKKSGARLLGCCPLPNHQDSSPSFNVYSDDRWYCFGCREYGDVVDLWAAIKGLQPIEAVLDLASEYSIQLPDRDPDAQKKASERRQKESDYARQAEACHLALSDHPNVVDWWQRRGFDEELRKQFLLGANHDGSAVIPFWHRGRIQGLIRRQLDAEPKYLLPKLESFPSEYRPLFIPGSTFSDLHLGEGYIDALALAALDLSAIAPGGTGFSSQQKAELEKLKGTLYIFPDADDEGAKASREWAKEFYPKAKLCPAKYGKGRKDVADLFAAEGAKAKAKLEKLKAQAVDALDLAMSEAPSGSTRGRYNYAKAQILPLLRKLEDEGERYASLDDVVNQSGLKIELKRLLKAELKSQTESESETTKEEEPSNLPLPGSERYERAMELLSKPNLLKLAVKDMEQLGHVGEYVTKQLAFICAVSARAGHPIQPSTHAQSSSGKNILWDTVLALMPPENVVNRSALSSKALYRTQANLKGGILYIQEVAGSEDADYTIRVMQSGGCLEYEATEKAPDGSLRNVVYKIEGPTVIIQTTTKNHLHPENETRVFPIYIDESEEQTERIVQSILKEAAGGGLPSHDRQAILEVWRDALRLLEPGEVVIPYAKRIQMPSSVIRIRRDARRLLDVVRVVAWLHQRQRERDGAGHIMATEEDFEIALKLVSESLARAWQTVTPAEQKVFEAIQKLPEEKQTGGFKRRDLKVIGISERRVKEVLKSLADTGYLDSDGRSGPQGYTYTVAKEMETINLGIFLAAQSPDSQQVTVNNEDTSGDVPSPDSARSPDNKADSEDYQASGDNGRNGHRPINRLDLEQLASIGRTGGGDGEETLTPIEDACEPIQTGPAIWRNQDSDQPVEVTGDLGIGSDGRRYVSIADSLSAIPSDELLYPKEDWGEI
jgi:DNA primase